MKNYATKYNNMHPVGASVCSSSTCLLKLECNLRHRNSLNIQFSDRLKIGLRISSNSKSNQSIRLIAHHWHFIIYGLVASIISARFNSRMSGLFKSSSSFLDRGSKRLSRSKLFQDDEMVEDDPNLGEDMNGKFSVLGIENPSRDPQLKQSTLVSGPKSCEVDASLKQVEVKAAAKKANLSIRLEDETRIVAGLQSAVKKQTSGSIYSVVVDVSKSGTLDIGVKDLADNLLAVSLLKRKDDKPGAGEEAGIRLGDVIFGVNFIPLREGSKTLISIIKDNSDKKKKILHIQGWRCHQLCSDAIPGYIFPRADEMMVHSYGLYRSKVFSEWERWNFIEIMLG